MITTTLDSAALRSRLVDRLVVDGFLHERRWRHAFRAVPREALVDAFTVRDPRTGTLTHYDVDVDPTPALAALYSNVPLLTQRVAGAKATPNSATPARLALMLERLDAHPGHRVLEIGTGTGYLTALLCHELGHRAVTGVDRDPQLVEQARARIAELGYRPRLVAGNAAHGAPSTALYDRVVATDGLPWVPPAWLPQVRPGGVILIDVGFLIVRLSVSDDRTAIGRFTDYAASMHPRVDAGHTGLSVRDILAAANRRGRTDRGLRPSYLEERPLQCLHAIVFPHVHKAIVYGDDDSVSYALTDSVSGAWARAWPDGDGYATVVHGGPRNLWSDLTGLARWWNDRGRPEPTRFGLTVAADGAHVLWIDRPDRVVTRLPVE
ncbi:methyltransferase domain-containing protein [Saccharomonospora azurea]|uniref:methyltransferase domain-containing protein n=1 Tax=Saccharomonospora azurea TaxID=40988 RepID=UPI003325492C